MSKFDFVSCRSEFLTWFIISLQFASFRYIWLYFMLFLCIALSSLHFNPFIHFRSCIPSDPNTWQKACQIQCQNICQKDAKLERKKDPEGMSDRMLFKYQRECHRCLPEVIILLHNCNFLSDVSWITFRPYKPFSYEPDGHYGLKGPFRDGKKTDPCCFSSLNYITFPFVFQFSKFTLIQFSSS